MALTAKITKLNKRETEVDVSILFSDSDNNINETLDFTQALSDTIDQDIQDIIQRRGNELHPIIEVKPEVIVNTSEGEQFQVIAPSIYEEAKLSNSVDQVVKISQANPILEVKQ